MPDRSVIVLSSWGAPILVPVLEEMRRVGVPVRAVVFDGMKSERMLQVHRERMAGFFEFRTMFDLDDPRLQGHFVNDHNSAGCLQLLEALEADILVNGGVQQIIKRDLLSLPRTGVVNCHPGLLPKYRGATCVEWALYNDDPLGASCHFMNEKLDAGPLICSRQMDVHRGEPYEQVRARMMIHSAVVMAEGVRAILDQDLHPAMMEPLPTDSYFSIIPEDLLEQAKARLREGTYSCYVD